MLDGDWVLGLRGGVRRGCVGGVSVWFFCSFFVLSVCCFWSLCVFKVVLVLGFRGFGWGFVGKLFGKLCMFFSKYEVF